MLLYYFFIGDIQHPVVEFKSNRLSCFGIIGSGPIKVFIPNFKGILSSTKTIPNGV